MNTILRLLFPQEKVAKQINSVLRKALLALSVLIATKVPFLDQLADYITQNADVLANDWTAAIMAVLVVLWGTKEKK